MGVPKQLIALLTALILFSGCSPAFKVWKESKAQQRARNRIERIATRHELYQDVQRDTVYYRDTLVSEVVKMDTAFVGDTVTIVKDGIRIVYKRDSFTTHIAVECPPDTFVIDKAIPCPECPQIIKEGNPLLNYLNPLKWLMVALFLIYLLTRFLKRR